MSLTAALVGGHIVIDLIFVYPYLELLSVMMLEFSDLVPDLKELRICLERPRHD